MKYKLLKARFDYKAGTIVYDQEVYDYGLAREDTWETGVEHISVTLKENGDYPGFTVAAQDLEVL